MAPMDYKNDKKSEARKIYIEGGNEPTSADRVSILHRWQLHKRNVHIGDGALAHYKHGQGMIHHLTNTK